jgi:osmotically-inducible protein OsmY
MTMRYKISLLLLAVVLLAGGCTAMTGQTAGQYVDDSTITASVKSKLATDKVGTLTRIDVDTTNQVVSLNGIVQSPDDKARAEQLAKEVSGVRDVKNNLQIQKKNP